MFFFSFSPTICSSSTNIIMIFLPSWTLKNSNKKDQQKIMMYRKNAVGRWCTQKIMMYHLFHAWWASPYGVPTCSGWFQPTPSCLLASWHGVTFLSPENPYETDSANGLLNWINFLGITCLVGKISRLNLYLRVQAEWDEIFQGCFDLPAAQDAIVTTRMTWTIFRIGNPNLNLYLWLEFLGGG